MNNSKIVSTRIFTITIAIVILFVAVVLFLLNRPKPDENNPQKTTDNQAQLVATLKLAFIDNQTKDFKVGQAIPLKILIETAQREVLGADCLVEFNPDQAEIKDIKGGDFFNMYPSLDVTDGLLWLAGFSLDNETKKETQNEITVGSFNLIPKKSGELKLRFRFQPFATNDSNILEAQTNLDILGKIEDLTINVN